MITALMMAVSYLHNANPYPNVRVWHFATRHNVLPVCSPNEFFTVRDIVGCDRVTERCGGYSWHIISDSFTLTRPVVRALAMMCFFSGVSDTLVDQYLQWKRDGHTCCSPVGHVVGGCLYHLRKVCGMPITFSKRQSTAHSQMGAFVRCKNGDCPHGLKEVPKHIGQLAARAFATAHGDNCLLVDNLITFTPFHVTYRRAFNIRGPIACAN